eukprot:TRINITY_DN6605_c0_g2_i1.p1 TRINITY_DN6605_c0_g2~~TRINITY_DN6605_c0_g2_i1.p1  ORF type:complete len:851 (+),score=185.76 TRINITY_DN6605_c0_g2_i1:64-2616(+)
MQDCCPGRVMGFIRSRMRRKGDTDTVVQHKAAWVGTLALFSGWSALYTAWMPGMVVTSAVCLSLFLWPWVQREVSEGYLCAAAAALSLLVMYHDAIVLSQWRRHWTQFVMVVDMLLVVQAPRYLTKCVVAVAMMWLLVVEIERATRMVGLLDLPSFVQDSYARRRDVCQCEEPPCAHQRLDESFNALGGASLVFLVDFLLTRGFADQVLSEKTKMAAAVQAAGDISRSLAGFDLEAAGTRLALARADLPDDLHTHLQRLLDNLASYRSYLPQECFPAAPGDSPRSAGSYTPTQALVPCDGTAIWPATGDGGSAAIVVTSVWQSGVLWENCSSAMHSALSIHHSMVRAALYRHRGHEINAFGDFYMVAFADVEAAVRFGAAVLVNAEKEVRPEGLQRPGSEADGFPVFTLKVGTDYGPVVVERSTLTGRAEVLGVAVARASRAEQVGLPRTVTVTAAAKERLPRSQCWFVTIPYSLRGDEEGGAAVDAYLNVWAFLPEAFSPWEGTLREKIAELQCMPAGDTSTIDLALSEFFADSCDGGDPHEASLTNIRERTARDAATVGFIQCGGPVGGAAALSWATAEMALNARLELLHGHLEATHGRISCVLSDLVLVSWGIHDMRCTQHVNESARFLLLLNGARSELSFHAGVVSGGVACGVVAPAAAQRHVTMLGPCVDVALALALGAAEVGADVLVASLGGGAGATYESNEFLSRHLWPVDRWAVHEGAPLTVYELCLRGAAEEMAAAERRDGARPDAAALERYVAAFASRDVATLQLLAAAGHRPAAHVAALWQGRRHLAHRQPVAGVPRAPIPRRSHAPSSLTLTVRDLRREDADMPLSTAQVLEAIGGPA